MRHYAIDEPKWQSYLEFISRITLGQRVELAVAGLDIGAQTQSDWTPMGGISYDPESHTLFVHTEPIEHLIAEPVEIVALADHTTIHALSIRDGQGRVQTLTFRHPLLLGAGEDQRH